MERHILRGYEISETLTFHKRHDRGKAASQLSSTEFARDGIEK